MVTGLMAGALPLWSQMVILSPKENSISTLQHIVVTVAGKPGASCRLFVNGTPADSGKIRIDGQYDFLNIPVPPGPVEIRTEAEGARNKTYNAVRNIHIVGPVANLKISRENIELPADGRSTTTLHAEIQDAWGKPVDRVKYVTLGIRNGAITDTDIDSAASGWQIPVSQSTLNFTILAADKVGQSEVTVDAGGKQFRIPVRYTTPLPPFMMVGSVDAAVSAFQNTDTIMTDPRFTLADYTRGESEINGIPVSGRMAFYARGSILRKYKVTASYDSRRTRENQLFRDIDPNEQYALYGDASTITYDAQTQSRFYGKIERNESHIVVGDYNTNMRSTEFTAYDRSFNGIRTNLQAAGQRVSGFATLNDRKMQLDEIRGEGISGYYFLKASRITINSDKVRIEVRDRYHPERIIKSEEKVRFADYDINYVDGTLMFKQPVPSVDASGNPVFIVAAYEYRSDDDKSMIGGIRYEGTWRNRFQIGSSFIMEEKEPANYMLYGADAVLPFFRWLEIRGEYARSRDTGFNSPQKTGSAYKTEISLKPHAVLSLDGYYRRVESDFYNPSKTGTQFEMGAEKYGASMGIHMGRFGTVRSGWYRQYNKLNTVNENHVEVTSAEYIYNVSERTKLSAGYEDAVRDQAGQDSTGMRNYNSRMIKGKISHQWTDRLATTAEHDQNLSGNENSLPTGTAVGVEYRLTDKLHVFAKERFLSEGERRTQTILGIDSRVTDNTQITSKYEIGGAAGEQLNRATIGLRNRWKVRPYLTLNFALESTATMDSLEVPTPDHSAVSVGYEYLPGQTCISTGKYELMQNQTLRKHVIVLANEMKINHGLSVINKIEHMHSIYKNNEDVWIRGNYQLGFAWRPEMADVFNTVGKIQYLKDKNTHVMPAVIMDRIIASMHAFWQIRANLSIGGRFALRKLMDEESGFYKTSTLTSLIAFRTELEWHRRWTSSLDMRWVHMNPVNQNKFGLSVDAAYIFHRNMEIGLGYILKNLDDNDFSISEYNYSNFFLVFRMKFSEDLFDWR